MDTEQFLMLAEEIAKEHPDDEVAAHFLELCHETVTNERDCIYFAGQVIMKYPS